MFFWTWRVKILLVNERFEVVMFVSMPVGALVTVLG